MGIAHDSPAALSIRDRLRRDILPMQGPRPHMIPKTKETEDFEKVPSIHVLTCMAELAAPRSFRRSRASPYLPAFVSAAPWILFVSIDVSP